MIQRMQYYVRIDQVGGPGGICSTPARIFSVNTVYGRTFISQVIALCCWTVTCVAEANKSYRFLQPRHHAVSRSFGLWCRFINLTMENSHIKQKRTNKARIVALTLRLLFSSQFSFQHCVTTYAYGTLPYFYTFCYFVYNCQIQ